MKINKKNILKILKKSFSEKKTCYYRILGLQRDASKSDIKKKFIQLAKEYHPDINTDKTSQKLFKEISEAYGILSNKDLKNEYDKKFQYENKPENFEEEYFEDLKNMKKEDFEKFNQELKKDKWENKKKEANYKMTKDYLNKKYFENDYETKNPLNNWNFDIKNEIKKNDKEKIFYESHTRFRMGEHYEYWEKDEDLKNDHGKNVTLEVFREFGPLYNFFIAFGGATAGLFYFFPDFLNNFIN